MSIYLVAAALLCLCSIRFDFKNGFEDYASPRETGAIKGVFVFLILFSHVRQYTNIAMSPANAPFVKFFRALGQLIVVAFLFYSGYGVACGIRNKKGYVRAMPVKRVLKTLVHFDTAVLLFAAVAAVMGKKIALKKVLLSLLCLDDCGNSSWFIFDIILLYLLTFSAFILVKKRVVLGTCLLTLFSLVAVFVIFKWKGADQYWWYDSILCYPLGMWFALVKPLVDKLVLPDFNRWFACVSSVGTVFSFAMYLLPRYNNSRLIFIPAALLFAALIVLVSMRVKISGPVLCWFGSRVFEIYILQRIPMTVLTRLGANGKPFLFAAVCFALTIVLAEAFRRFADKLDAATGLAKKTRD